jgi:hypothetical protein
MTFDDVINELRRMPVWIENGKIKVRCRLTDQQRETIKRYRSEIIAELTKPYPGSTRYLWWRPNPPGAGKVIHVLHTHKDLDSIRAMLGPSNVEIRHSPETPGRTVRIVRIVNNGAA